MPNCLENGPLDPANRLNDTNQAIQNAIRCAIAEGGGLPTDGFDNQALLFGDPPFWGTDIVGRAGDDDFPVGDTVTLTGGDANSPVSGSAGGVILTGGSSAPGSSPPQIQLGNTTGGEGGFTEITGGGDTTGGGNALITVFAAGNRGSGVGGDIEITPGTGSGTGLLLLSNLPTAAPPAQPHAVWNNSGALNIGAGGSGGGSVQTAKVSLTSAQLLALNATPIQIVPAPGAGKFVSLLSALFDYTAVTTPYNSDDFVGIFYGTDTTIDSACVFGIGGYADDALAPSAAGSTEGTVAQIVNQGLYVGSQLGLTDGDGTLKVTANYIVNTR